MFEPFHANPNPGNGEQKSCPRACDSDRYDAGLVENRRDHADGAVDDCGENDGRSGKQNTA